MRIEPITENEWKGLTLEEAIKKSESIGYIHRIVERDGKHMMLDMDVKSNRVNFRISGDYITAVYTG
jgi:hypothetical protein